MADIPLKKLDLALVQALLCPIGKGSEADARKFLLGMGIRETSQGWGIFHPDLHARMSKELKILGDQIDEACASLPELGPEDQQDVP